MKTRTEERERYTESDYDDMLRECYGDVTVCGLTYDAAYALKEIDPTAYRCGFADFQEYETVYTCSAMRHHPDKPLYRDWGGYGILAPEIN